MSDLADVYGDRHRGSHEGFNDELFDFVDAGQSFGQGADAGGDRGGAGGDGDAGNVYTGQGADEFYGVAVNVIAADKDVTGAYAVQGLYSGGKGGDDLVVILFAGKGDNGCV